MVSFTDRKILMRCIKQLEEKVMVDQHYRSSEKVDCNNCNCILIATSFVIFFFQHDPLAQFGSGQDWSAS